MHFPGLSGGVLWIEERPLAEAAGLRVDGTGNVRGIAASMWNQLSTAEPNQ